MAHPNTDHTYPLAAATASGQSIGASFTATVDPASAGTITPAGGGSAPIFSPAAAGPFTIYATAPDGRTGTLEGTVTVEPLLVTFGTPVPK